MRDYPNDPRAHHSASLKAARANDLAAMESAARRAVELIDADPNNFKQDYRLQMIGVRAFALAQLGRLAEAKSIARETCGAQIELPIKTHLTSLKVCD